MLQTTTLTANGRSVIVPIYAGGNTTCDRCDASIPLEEAAHSLAHSGEALCYACLETAEPQA